MGDLLASGATPQAPLFHVHAPPGVALGVRPFVLDGELRLSVIVKLALELRYDQPARLVPASPIALSDVYEEDKPAGSVIAAGDLALRKPACDVTMVGEARAPGGQAAAMLNVRLAIYRGERPLMRKTVVAMSPTPEGISAVPLTHEHTFGGADVRANPLGSRAPLVQLARDALQQPGCFAPIPAAWPLRRDRLDKATRNALTSAVPEIRASADWGYFQAAPEDQTVPFLLGGEWLVIDGVSAQLPRMQTQLPHLDVRALLVERSGVKHEVPLVWDTLAIDGSAFSASVVLRGDVASPVPLAQSTDLAVTVRFGDATDSTALAPSALFSDDNLAIALHRTPLVALAETAALNETQHDLAARRPVAPYTIEGGSSSPEEVEPRVTPPAGSPWSAEPARRVTPAAARHATIPLRQEDLQPPREEPPVQAQYELAPVPPAPKKERPAASAPAAPTGPSRVALATAALRKSGMSEAALSIFIRQLESEIGSDV